MLVVEYKGALLAHDPAEQQKSSLVSYGRNGRTGGACSLGWKLNSSWRLTGSFVPIGSKRRLIFGPENPIGLRLRKASSPSFATAFQPSSARLPCDELFIERVFRREHIILRRDADMGRALRD